MAISDVLMLVIWVILGIFAGGWFFTGVALAIAALASDDFRESWLRLRLVWLRVGLVAIALPILALGYTVFLPYVSGGSADTAAARNITMPDYDVKPWHSLPVQYDGRVMPFETACRQAMQQITGVSKFEATGGQESDIWAKTWKRMTGKKESIDAVAIVLQWMSLHGESYRAEFVDWENYPFILCPHHDLRKEIYKHLEEKGEQLTEEQKHGKYISPADLRSSPAFFTLLTDAQEKRRQDPEKATHIMSPEMRKAEEVSGRLELFDQISQNNPVAARRQRQHPDPFHFVALDKVPGGAWFAIGDLRESERDPDKWREEMHERLAHAPQLYIKPEIMDALRKFQEEVKSGQTQDALDKVKMAQPEQRQQLLEELKEVQKAHDSKLTRVSQFLHLRVAANKAEMDQLEHLLQSAALAGIDPEKDKEKFDAAVVDTVRTFLTRRDQQAVENLQARIGQAQKSHYHPDDPKFRMLHLDYLETRFPNVYRESAAWQEYPKEDAEQVLVSYFGVRDAYISGNADQFKAASEKFFQTLQSVSEKVTGSSYPGDDTTGIRLAGLMVGRPVANPSRSLLDLEMRYNRAQPFQWAWVLMLVSAAGFITYMVLKSRVSYWLALSVFLASMALQLFGFYARVVLAGRPPVSNMYETLIWVPFMCSSFALILELVYRRGVIALAGAVAATLGLIVSDLLPVELGAKISPIVPVLRSNYWLTIHVLTIVSSYAGGALAWMMGNIALALLAFGKPRLEMLKTLSQFSYRAMQIAVLLLAAGTFLGGWWAADSWGRFWGWDPKEVWALIALVCYVIPLHMRFIGWIKDFGLAVAAVICFAFIVFSWYGVNFVLAAGLHSYGFGTGSPWMIGWFALLNLEFVLATSLIYLTKTRPPLAPAAAELIEA